MMVKKMLLEVQKKRLINRNKKKLLKKVIDFLISDSYMFALLISHPPHGFSSPMKTKASITGVEGRKPIKGNNKRLLKKVGDYLKSDSYMYAPLLASPPSASTSSPPKGTISPIIFFPFQF
ncbi:unnamed protein product [Prunus armeniaca]